MLLSRLSSRVLIRHLQKLQTINSSLLNRALILSSCNQLRHLCGIKNHGTNDNSKQLSKNDTQSMKSQPIANSWINSGTIPSYLKPYLHLIRIDKQVGTLLLLWPCCWSIALAAPIGHLPDILILAKFGIGALLMRSAGCIINDMWDKDLDKHVERTRLRPLASGELTMFQASVALLTTLSGALGILLSLQWNSIFLGFASMPVVILYPLMKRFTHFPQLVLGFAMNWGALLGWTEVTGSCSLIHTLPLYIGGICWTLVYDTIYGYQDCDDDKKLGLKSTSLYLGETPLLPLSVCAMTMVTGVTAAGYSVGLILPFYIGMAGVSSHLAWQLITLDIKNKTNLWTRFNSNQHVGLLVTFSIIAGHF